MRRDSATGKGFYDEDGVYINEFYVNDVSYPTEITGVITVSPSFRGKIGAAKINGKGSPVMMTPNGYVFDEVKSALQKSIRRGLVNEALVWASIMYDMGGPFRSNLVNRLMVIVDEDVGLANPWMAVAVVKSLKEYFGMEEGNKKKLVVMKIVKALAQSKKSRIVDSIIHAVMEPNVKNWPEGHNKVIYKAVNEKRYRGKKGDSKRFVRYMNYFISAFTNEDLPSFGFRPAGGNVNLDQASREATAVYWLQRIYDLPLKMRHCAVRDTYRGRSDDCMYGVWEFLLGMARGNKIDTEVVRSALWLYDKKKNRRTERMFIVKVVLYFLRKTALRCYRVNFGLSAEEWEIVVNKPILRMDKRNVDKHTYRGKNKTSEEFWKVGAFLANECKRVDDVYFERAMKLNMQRDNENIKPPKREKGKKKKAPKKSRQSTLRLFVKKKQLKRKRNVVVLKKKKRKTNL